MVHGNEIKTKYKTMGIGKVNLNDMESYQGDNKKSFEHLCYQIVGEKFKDEILKGARLTSIDDSGGGAGIEFYLEFSNGNIWGWQCKYVDRFGNSQKEQVKKSLSKSYKQYGDKLKKWFLCSKNDLTPTSKDKNGKVTRGEDLWFSEDLAKTKISNKQILPDNHGIDLIHWGDSEILACLGKYPHINNFFFEKGLFDLIYFKNKYDENKATSIKDKYNDLLHTGGNIDEEIVKLIGGLEFQNIYDFRYKEQEIDSQLKEYSERYNTLFKTKLNKKFEYIQNEFQVLLKGKENLFKELVDNINTLKDLYILGKYNEVLIHKKKIDIKIENIKDISSDFHTLHIKLIDDNADFFDVYEYNKEEYIKKHGISSSEFDLKIKIRKKYDDMLSRYFLSNIFRKIENVYWLFNKSNNIDFHISGGAGVGKTHISFNIYEKQIKKGLPSIFILGNRFIENELFEIQLLKILNIPSNIGIDDFLGGLNQAGKVYDCKVPIVIDGLNEALNWKNIFSSLSNFIEKLKKYSNLVLITTFRTTYQEEIFGEYMLNHSNSTMLHGFNYYNLNEAVKKYFKLYNIRIINNFYNKSYFDKPIYLKIFCEVNKGQKVDLNKESIFLVFDKYLEKSNSEIINRLSKEGKLVKRGNHKFLYKQLETIALKLWNNNSRWLPFDEIEDSKQENLNILINNDLLLDKIIKDEEVFGFTYDLLGGYIIAKNLINENQENLIDFIKSKDFQNKLIDNKHNLYEDILHCLNILLIQKDIFLFDYYDDEIIISESIEGIFELEKDKIVNNKDKIINFLEKCFLGDYKDEIWDYCSIYYFDSEHPLNGLFWHKLLGNFSLADRDSFWSSKIGIDSDTLEWIKKYEKLEKSLKKDYNDGDKKLLLIGIFYSWFLTTTNNAVRDKMTKLLIVHFTDRPKSFLEVLISFLNVNDPYIIQRLLAISLGIIFRSDKTDDVKEFIKFIYKYFYVEENIPIDILGRDYLKLMVEFGVKKLGLDLDLKITKYPYKSEFDENKIPSLEELEKYQKIHYKGENEHSDDIWYSVMYSQGGGISDFGRYILGSKVKNWSNIKITAPKIPTEEELTEKLYNSLGLDKTKELESIEERIKKDSWSNLVISIDKDVIKKKTSVTNVGYELLSAFLETLKKEQLNNYNTYRDFKDEIGRFEGRKSSFNRKIAERWIYNRTIELGYDLKKHGDFDRTHGRRMRDGGKVERIGKKYQWIALYELLARISDNYKFFADSWESKESSFVSPQTTFVRDIDPTHISKSQEFWYYDEELEKYLYTDISNKNFIKNERKLNNSDWILSDDGIPNYNNLIERKDDEGVEWCLLEGYFSISERDEKGDLNSSGGKQFRNQIRSYFVKDNDSKELIDWLKKQNFMGRELMPESSDNHYSYLGEMYWSESYNNLYTEYYGYKDWTDEYGKLPKKVIVTAENYRSERSGDDTEGLGHTNLIMFGKFLGDELGCEWNDKKESFVNKKGEIIGFNPIIKGVKENSLLIRKDVLLKFLTDKKLKIVYTVLGEKLILGTRGGKRKTINGIYYFDKDNNIKGINKSFIEK